MPDSGGWAPAASGLGGSYGFNTADSSNRRPPSASAWTPPPEGFSPDVTANTWVPSDIARTPGMPGVDRISENRRERFLSGHAGYLPKVGAAGKAVGGGSKVGG